MSLAEPGFDAFPYAGWMPTANGRLSFRHIGESRHPSEAFYANVTTETNRYLVAFQLRSLSDQFFQFVTHFYYGTEERFYFAITAESSGPPESAEQLRGTVYIYKSEEDWLSSAAEVVAESVNNINDTRLTIDNDRDEKIRSEFDTAENQLQATSDIEVEFILWRTGEIFFADPIFADDALREESVTYAASLKQDFLKWPAAGLVDTRLS